MGIFTTFVKVQRVKMGKQSGWAKRFKGARRESGAGAFWPLDTLTSGQYRL